MSMPGRRLAAAEGRACTAVLLKAAGPRVSRGVEQRGRAPSRRSFVNGRATRAQESAVPLMFDAMQPFNGEARIVVAACDNLVTRSPSCPGASSSRS